MISSAENWIKKLGLEAHPEGGFFKEVFRAEEIISRDALPERYNSERCFSTSIYFLLDGKQFSAFHKLKSDEIWHFYEGSPLEIYIIDEKSDLSIMKLGRDIDSEESHQITIRRGNWFAARLIDQNTFSLIGCTVSPGFNFEDFELGKRDDLLSQFPQYSEVITQLTRR